MIIILILFFFPLEFTNETDVHTFAVFGEKCVTIVDYHSAAQTVKMEVLWIIVTIQSP